MAKQSTRSLGLDDLETMALFARVVKTSSFTAAARDEGMTTSSVSKRIARLEERLGVQLLARTTRAVSPTEAGMVFFEHAVRILADVEEAQRAVLTLGGKPRGTLRIAVMPSLGEVDLGPTLTPFLAKHPELGIDADVTDRPVNLAAEGYDVAVCSLPTAARPDSSLIARRIGAVRTVVCAAPSYLDRRGVPRSLDDLAAHECLHYSAIPLQQEWTFTTPEGPRVVPVDARLQANSLAALRGAAISGIGLLRTSQLMVGGALASGALRTVLDTYAAI